MSLKEPARGEISGLRYWLMPISRASLVGAPPVAAGDCARAAGARRTHATTNRINTPMARPRCLVWFMAQPLFRTGFSDGPYSSIFLYRSGIYPLKRDQVRSEEH